MEVVSDLLTKISNALLASPADEASPFPREPLPGRGQANHPAGSPGVSGSLYALVHPKRTIVVLGRMLHNLVPLEKSA
jgi:hypothetical protein